MAHGNRDLPGTAEVVVPLNATHAEGALDALASIVRDTGVHAFNIDDDLETFQVHCEGWARHVLTGAIAPGAGGIPDEVRAWPQLTVFYRERRKAEQAFVNGRLSEFKGIIWDIVHGLREITATGSAAETSIATSLQQLEVAAGSDSLETVRAALGPAVASIRDALDQQRDRFDAEMRRMTSRLDQMRADLSTAREQMQVDALTRVYNRGAFDEALQRYADLAVLSRQPLALIMLDLDHFKEINDRLGHPIGDEVLRQTARCLVKCFLRKNDFVARYGGEEFAVILGDTPPDVIPRLARNAIRSLRELDLQFDGQRVRLTASAGYATLRAGETAPELLARVDSALYKAKSEGRNRAVAGAGEATG